MNKLVFTLILFLITSIAQSQEIKKADLDIIRNYRTNKMGLLNRSTKDTLIPCKYDRLKISKNVNFAMVSKGNLYGAVDLKGNEILPLEYSSISDQGNFILVVSQVDLFGLYAITGDEIIPERYAYLGKVSEGKLRANEGGKAYYGQGIFSGESVEVTGGKWSFLDTNGRVISRLNLTYARDFKDGIASVYVGGKNDDWVYGGNWTYLKSNGTLIMNGVKDISRPIDGLFAATCNTPKGVKNEKKFLKNNEPPFDGVIDKKGQVVLPFQFSDVQIYSQDFIKCERQIKNKDGKEDYIIEIYNSEGKKIVENPIEEIKSHEKYVKIKSNGLWGIYTRKGREILPPEYDIIWEFNAFLNQKKTYLQVGKTENDQTKFGLFDWNGNNILPIAYDNIWNQSDYRGIILTKKGRNHSSYINWEKVLSMDCDTLFIANPKRVFKDTLFQVELANQSLIVDLKGQKLFDMPGTKIIHTTEILDNKQNVFVAVKEGKQGLIRMDKRILIPFKFDNIVSWTSLENNYDVLQYKYKKNLIEATYEGKKTVINSKGDILMPPVKGDFEISVDPYSWKINRLMISKVEDQWPNDRKYGGMDTLGNIITLPKWDALFFLPNNHYVAHSYSKEPRCGLFKNGQTNPEIEFEWFSIGSELNLQNITGNLYTDSIMFFKIKDQWFPFDVYASKLGTNHFDRIQDDDFYCDMSIVEVDGKKGIIDPKGNYLVQPLYEDLRNRAACVINSDYHTKNGQEYAAKLNGRWGGITTKGKKLTEFKFESPEAVWKSDGDFFKW